MLPFAGLSHLPWRRSAALGLLLAAAALVPLLGGSRLMAAAAKPRVVPAPSDPPAKTAPSATSAPAKVEPDDQAAKLDEAAKRAESALATKDQAKSPAEEPLTALTANVPKVDWFSLLTVGGGPLMIPIWGISVLVIALAVERLIVLRRGNVLPRRLVGGLKSLARGDNGIDPRDAYRLCQKYPSAAATVIRVMLVKVDRPQAEIDQAVREASQREADRLHGKVRWFTLAATIEPMLGLLGTVQGMIMAFYITAHLPPGANRAVFLAESIYIALVTTFGGLVVAIPAAVLGHYYTGRILRLFGEMDDLLLMLSTQIDRFRRHRRAAREQMERAPAGSGVEPPPVARPDDGRSKAPSPART